MVEIGHTTGTTILEYRNRILLPVLILLATSCGRETTPGILDLSNQKNGKELGFNDLCASQTWIELEATDEAMIGDAKRVIEYDSNYYILDCFRQKRVLVFDKDGKFLRGIGTMGSGPGEYADIVDFTINTADGKIAILCSPSTIFEYNQDGTFISSKKISESVIWEVTYANGYYVCSTDHATYTEGENANLLYFFDSEWEEKGKGIKVLPTQMPRLEVFSGQLSSTGNQVFYMDVFPIGSTLSHLRIYPHSPLLM